MSRRAELFSAIKAELEKVDGAHITDVPRPIEELRDRGLLPTFVVSYEEETKEMTATAGPSNKHSTIIFGVSVFARTETDPIAALNELFEKAEKEIDDDPKLGKAYPVYARVTRVAAEPLAFEVDDDAGARYGVGGMEITIDYRHERATP